MEDFLKKMKIEIASINSIEELDEWSTRLSKALENLQNPILAKLRGIIIEYRQKSEIFFSFGSGEKADKIEHAIAQMSLEQRMHLHQSNNLEQDLENVLSQLASKRMFGESEVCKDFRESLKKMKAMQGSSEKQSSDNNVDEGSSPTKPKI